MRVCLTLKHAIPGINMKLYTNFIVGQGVYTKQQLVQCIYAFARMPVIFGYLVSRCTHHWSFRWFVSVYRDIWQPLVNPQLACTARLLYVVLFMYAATS